ncbi:hypothetical protein [Sulfitobacter pontiacus]|uniref:hypothetical protein n=1 Tax=Sulfitobacter pontiacus TaxID=60137 RepID=UPI00276EBE5E|nr:hypothetical protein [Sulfitobacter pontiacus]GLO79157.1 hypothetical protein MACH23_25780 [Sulfitobacter pontiacus]
MTAAPPEEQDLLHWRISPRAFFWRCVALAVLTMLFTLPLLIWLDPITWLLASVLIAVFYMWVFEEFQIWFSNRNTVWRLTNRALYINAPDTAEPLVLPLTDIRSIGKLSFWSISLGLPDRQRITLPLVPNRAETKARLAQAIEAAS